MLEFFTTIMIITGGVFCILLWLVVAALIFIELIDLVGTDQTPGVIELEENDYGYGPGGSK